VAFPDVKIESNFGRVGVAASIERARIFFLKPVASFGVSAFGAVLRGGFGVLQLSILLLSLLQLPAQPLHLQLQAMVLLP
jgi:hypothetical protein